MNFAVLILVFGFYNIRFQRVVLRNLTDNKYTYLAAANENFF